MVPSYAVFCGIDVGKGDHHAVGLRQDVTERRGKAEGSVRQPVHHGSTLVVVDQPNTIGALPVTVARACGHDVAYLPGQAIRRIADLYPGQAKRCPRCVHHRRHRPRHAPGRHWRRGHGRARSAGFDDDLAGKATRVSNRIRGLLTAIHPTLERVVGPRATHPTVLETISRCGEPAGIRKAG